MFRFISSIFKFKKKSVAPLQSEATTYYMLGGERNLNKLVERFYWHMDNDPQAIDCRNLHKESLDDAQRKLKMFLSGWLGGPSLYIQAYGHPMMRKRHFPFKIGPKERDQWLYCMRLALDELKLENNLDSDLWQGFRKFAEHMRNSEH